MKSFVYMKHGWCNYVNMRERYTKMVARWSETDYMGGLKLDCESVFFFNIKRMCLIKISVLQAFCFLFFRQLYQIYSMKWDFL